jgi:hypothetical protein
MTGITMGVGIGVLAIITLVAIWSARRQLKTMKKVKLQRKWTNDENWQKSNSRNNTEKSFDYKRY